VQLHRAREEFEAAGADIVFIGQATPRHASHFRDRLGLEPLPILADEERRTYRIAGLGRGSTTQLLGPRSVLAGVKHGARSGVIQGRPIGDVAQLGGEKIIKPDGSVAWSHDQQHAGDTTSPDELLEVVRAAVRGS
jgi:AhpC/TSA antioxidant enzyme